jgi:ERCC4-related helicase
MPEAKKPRQVKPVKPVVELYMQNGEGRVFVATPVLLKQAKKGKFGLTRITKSVFDEALKNGGMTAALEDMSEDDL